MNRRDLDHVDRTVLAPAGGVVAITERAGLGGGEDFKRASHLPAPELCTERNAGLILGAVETALQGAV